MPLSWWADAADRPVWPPLSVSPSALPGLGANVIESLPLGRRIDTGNASDRSLLGEAIHACLAAGLSSPGRTLSVGDVQAILSRMGIGDAVEPEPLHGQVRAVQDWLRARWPDARALVELPVRRLRDTGQVVQGRIDLALHTGTGWVLFDHKSTPQGSGQWEALAEQHAGQLAGYREVLEAVSGLPVEEVWLLLPVAGAALRVGIQVEGELEERFTLGQSGPGLSPG